MAGAQREETTDRKRERDQEGPQVNGEEVRQRDRARTRRRTAQPEEGGARGSKEAGKQVGGAGSGVRGGHSECPRARGRLPPPWPTPLRAHHAQVVHKAGPVGPNVGRRTGQRLHADLLAAVQLPDGAHHHMHGVKHQGSR